MARPPVIPRPVHGLQNRLLRLLGGRVSERAKLVSSMLKRDSSETTGYWLQLLVAVGIATLGLVIGSTAVVIGAMLIAPLMEPILALAMALAAGSPFLVLRSSSRIVASIVAGVGGAALITLLVPFHELNVEIAARASPTVLDLLTACFCALAGVYSALHPGATVAATAAGTAIGVALVPPLCVCGYGLGTWDRNIAGGAALLFLTNLVAIVVVGSVAFLAAGFNRVDVVGLEAAELSREGQANTLGRRLGARLSTLFASRWGPVLRFLMPFVLLAGVFVPLRRALDEVAWQVRVRQQVTAAIAAEPLRVVESRVRVERQSVDVVLVALADMDQAEKAKDRLDDEVRRIAGVVPRVEVLAVPDAEAFEGLRAAMGSGTPREAQVVVAPPPPPPDPATQIDAVRARVREALAPFWPENTAGPALSIELRATEPRELRIVHLGEPLGPAARESVQRSVEQALECEVRVIDVAIPGAPLTRDGDDGDLGFVAALASGLRAAEGIPELRVCVEAPVPPKKGRWRPRAEVAFSAAVDGLLAANGQVRRREADDWRVRFTRSACDGDGGNADGDARGGGQRSDVDSAAAAGVDEVLSSAGAGAPTAPPPGVGASSSK